jgi:hypothetical protein
MHRQRRQCNDEQKSLLALGLATLLTAALLVPAAARGSETEDPFWKVAGSRLEAGSQSASIKNPSGVKTILHGKLSATEVAIHVHPMGPARSGSPPSGCRRPKNRASA